MPTNSKKEPVLVLDDPAEIFSALDRKLVEESCEKLVEFFGLGDRVTSALTELGCQNGLDLLMIDPNRAFLVAGEKTARRIQPERDCCARRWKSRRGLYAAPLQAEQAQKIQDRRRGKAQRDQARGKTCALPQEKVGLRCSI